MENAHSDVYSENPFWYSLDTGFGVTLQIYLDLTRFLLLMWFYLRLDHAMHNKCPTALKTSWAIWDSHIIFECQSFSGALNKKLGLTSLEHFWTRIIYLLPKDSVFCWKVGTLFQRVRKWLRNFFIENPIKPLVLKNLWFWRSSYKNFDVIRHKFLYISERRQRAGDSKFQHWDYNKCLIHNFERFENFTISGTEHSSSSTNLKASNGSNGSIQTEVLDEGKWYG